MSGIFETIKHFAQSESRTPPRSTTVPLDDSSIHDPSTGALTPAAAVAAEACASKDSSPGYDDPEPTPRGSGHKIESPVPSEKAASIRSVETTETTETQQTTESTSDEKRLALFHRYFDDAIEPGEQLVTHYSCAYQETVLLAGRLYISQKHLNFRASVFGYKKIFSIPFQNIKRIEKSMTALVIPNAITVFTDEDKEHFFASFLSRDATYDIMVDLWRDANPEAFEAYSAASQLDPTSDAVPAGEAEKRRSEAEPATATAGDGHPATQCESEPFEEVVLDVHLPTTPERVFELLWKTDAFMKQFWEKDQKLRDLDVGEWTGDKMKKRTMSYIKPLSGPVGPSQTKCEITDEELHVDPETYFETLTVARTPDVPSGNAFEVHTKTAIAWAGGAKGGTRVLVSTQVEWTGRSMLKGVITKSAIEGQRSYHKDLARAVRAHIRAHAAEFESTEAAGAADNELEEEKETADEAAPLPERLMSELMEAPSNPFVLGLLILVALLVITNIWTWVGWRNVSKGVRAARRVTRETAVDAQLVRRVEKLEAAWEALKVAVAHRGL